MHTFKISMRHKCDTYATRHDKSVHMLKFQWASMLVSFQLHGRLYHRLLGVERLFGLASWAYRIDDEQISGVAVLALLLARCVFDQREARNFSIGISADAD